MAGNSSIVNQAKLAEAIERLISNQKPRYRRLWAYFKNPMRLCRDTASGAAGGVYRPYRQAQEWGLPARITGFCSGGEPFIQSDSASVRREVVIENDIGWRIDTLVIFQIDLGKPSKTQKPKKRTRKQRPKPYQLKPFLARGSNPA